MKTFNNLLFLVKFLLSVNSKNSASTIVLILVICLQISSIKAQPNKDTERSAAETEQLAKVLSEQWSGDSFRRSIALFSETAKQQERLQIFSKASNNWREAAELELLLGNYQEARLNLKRALKIDASHNYPADKIKTLSILAIVSLKSGKIDRGKIYLNQAQILIESTNDISAQAMFAFSSAEFYEIQSKFGKALEFYQKSSNLWKESGDSRRAAYALVNCAYAYMTLGDPLSGLNKVKEAEIHFQEINDTRGLAGSRIASGHLYNAMDEKQLALDSYKTAEKLFPADIGFLEKARLYNGIGLIYEDYGEWKSSFDYRLKALELFRQENYPYGQIATLPSLISLSNRINDPVSATEYFFETQKLSARLNDTYYLAIALRLMGDYHFKKFSNSKALDLYLKSLKTLKKTGLKYEIAYIEDKLGTIYERLGERQKAVNYYESSLEKSRSILNKFTEANTTYNLSRIKSLENKNEDALKLINSSIEITEKLSSDFLNSKLTSNYFSNVFERYELYINLLMKMHKQSPNENYAIRALQAAEKSRARSMLENLRLSEANFNKDADPETIRREKEIRNLHNLKADKLTDALSRNSDQSEIQKLSDEIRILENELEETKAELKQNSPIYSAIKNPEPFNTTDFQDRVLDDATLLLEFSLGKNESFLWLIGKNFTESYVLPPRAQIESRVESLRILIESRGMLKDETIENYLARLTAAETLYAQEAQIFSDELLGQIRDKIKEKRLIIVPDGKLHYFPIAALPLPHSNDNQPILLSNEIIYEPSASMLTLLIQTERQQSAATKNLLVFSDPIFSIQDERIVNQASNKSAPETTSIQPEKLNFAQSLSSLSRLNASQAEADSIVQIIGDSASAAFTGAAATREQFLSQPVSEYKIIHFATHGLIDEAHPQLSGIVLSQFTETGETRNGVLRLQDIYGLNLAADLVVLSACETGIGKEVKGEGLASLNNAFMQVGAKSVLSSLWKVDDYATVELMKHFYKSLADGDLSAAQALRQAQIKLRENPRYQSPFFWAAFNVQGNFHKIVVNKPFAIGYWWFSAVLFLAVAIILATKYRKKAVRAVIGSAKTVI
jgi:CHAT domain-containing protein